ncbi:MAG TPA: phage tail tape measure protein, partial [Aggregatilineales bacterium]|nr:phage tail tape measure protein [Aggregatilineales bacterium]
GRDTKFSSQDAGEALLELLKSGMDLQEAMQTLPDVLNLAAVGEMSLSQATGIVSTGMTTFKLNTDAMNESLIAVPENFEELQKQLGITDDMFVSWGNNGDGFNAQLEVMALQLGTTTEGLYSMWNNTKSLTPEMEALANQLGVSQADWEAYQSYLDGTATSLDVVTPAIQALIDQTGVSGARLAQLFNPQMSASARTVNALAQAANASRADVKDLGDALADAGGIANNYGISIEETAAILGVFANNGIMGAQAGTQLRSMLTNMTDPTDKVKAAWKELGTSLYDSEGNLRDFNTVMLEVDAAMDALPIERQNELTQILAGSFGQLGFTALRASNGIGDMLAEMAAAPEAGALAEGFMDTFAGKVESLRGSFETLKIQAMTPFMNEVLGPFVDRVTLAVNAVTQWASENPELTV